MQEDILTLVATGGPLLTTARAARAGVTTDDLARSVAAGELRRIRRGLYVAAGPWDHAPPWERYRLTTLGVLEARPTWVASHHAALVLHGVAVHDVDLTHLDVAARVRTTKVRPGLHVHRLPETWKHLVTAEPRAIGVASACVLTAAASGVTAGVVSMDAALHGRRCTAADLTAALDHAELRYGLPRAREAVAASDGLSESPGETLTRLVLASVGAEVRPQVEIRDRDGFVGRVDFLVGGRVVVEFDGAQKYEGADGREALVREKRREDRLREAGYRVIRVTWSDLGNPARLVARVRAALASAA